MLTNKSFFDPKHIDNHQELFPPDGHPWDALKVLKGYLQEKTYNILPASIKPGAPLPTHLVLYEDMFIDVDGLTIEFGDATKGDLAVYDGKTLLKGASVIMAGAVLIGARIKFGKGVKIEPGAFIQEPALIDDHTEVRQGAYLRGNCLIGKRCVVGHVTEVKHAIFLDDAKAGHFAYIGDSILGGHVNLGAGTKLANLRFMGGNIEITTSDGPISTGLRKLGAIMGDNSQTGCNAVTNPGTMLGKKAIVLPNTTAASGYHPDNSIVR